MEEEIQYQRIKSQKMLDELLDKQENGSPLDCFILLSFGLRSSKEISFNDNRDYYVYNECDDSEEIIAHGNLMNTFIGEAINKQALYKY